MPSSYQVSVVNAAATFQNILDNKQVADSIAGNIASTLLSDDISESTTVLNTDAALVQSAATAGGLNNWTTSDSQNFNLANAVYQNDASISLTGQNNASSFVQAIQSEVSQDGTNISNAISIANILVQIGQYASSFLSKAYTAY